MKTEESKLEAPNKQLDIPVVMQRAFQFMLQNKSLILSDKGEKELHQISPKLIWRIYSINRSRVNEQFTLTIYGDKGFEGTVDFDWFVWDVV